MFLTVSSFYEFFVESNIFQLISMLVCIAVVVCFFIKKYATGKDIDDSEKKIQKLHTFYVSGILVFIIIELVTGICMGSPSHSEILNYVNFASTVSSLIMSVVAIIVTIVFSNRGSVQFGKLDTATDDVKHAVADLKLASSEMKGSLDDFSGKAQHIEDLVNVFQDDASSLKTALSDILDRLCNIEDKTEKTYEATMGESSRKTGESAKEHSISFQDFVSHSSFAGAKVLYACALSHETGIDIDLGEISDSERDWYYLYGYMIATQASGYIDFDGGKGNRVFKVTYVPENLKNLALDRLKEKISSFSKDSQPKYENKVKKIENYFNVPK